VFRTRRPVNLTVATFISVPSSCRRSTFSEGDIYSGAVGGFDRIKTTAGLLRCCFKPVSLARAVRLPCCVGAGFHLEIGGAGPDVAFARSARGGVDCAETMAVAPNNDDEEKRECKLRSRCKNSLDT
jgi:hypothetical protein